MRPREAWTAAQWSTASMRPRSRAAVSGLVFQIGFSALSTIPTSTAATGNFPNTGDTATPTACPLRAVLGVAPTRFVFLYILQRAIVECQRLGRRDASRSAFGAATFNRVNALLDLLAAVRRQLACCSEADLGERAEPHVSHFAAAGVPENPTASPAFRRHAKVEIGTVGVIAGR